MANSDDDWDKKDWDNFSIEVKAEANPKNADNWENVSMENQRSQDNHMFNLMSASSVSSNDGGHYALRKQNKTEYKQGAKAGLVHDTKDFVQKLPIIKIASIAGLSETKAFLELVTHQSELLETMKGIKISDRVMELLLVIIFRMCDCPFLEHRQNFLAEASAIVTFWQQVSLMTRVNIKLLLNEISDIVLGEEMLGKEECCRPQ